MRVAVIDLGTNTFNLLIADVSEGGFTVVHNSKEGVALGMGGINEQRITPEAMTRALKTFEKFNAICREHGVENIQAIGTSALRDAENSDELVDTVQRLYGVSIGIIDGLQEAQLIYDGVRWSYDFTQPSLIMDIGGGSTEFIRGFGEEKLQFCSLNIGVSRAVQSFRLSDPISDEDHLQLIDWFEENSWPLTDFKSCTTLVGASGSFETFYEMIHETPFPPGIAPIWLSRAELDDTLDWIIRSRFEERERHPYIIPIRRRLAPIAALQTKWILEKFDIKDVVISPCSLKEGTLKALIG
jgi:exopolyphosphatase / guanosine-5'-triphosphate,3'-diphosphate pyrophosphatase